VGRASIFHSRSSWFHLFMWHTDVQVTFTSYNVHKTLRDSLIINFLLFSVVSFLISSVIGALMTVALTGIAAVDLGSIYKCPKEDYRSALYFPAYCSKENWYYVIYASNWFKYFFSRPICCSKNCPSSLGYYHSINYTASCFCLFHIYLHENNI